CSASDCSPQVVVLPGGGGVAVVPSCVPGVTDWPTVTLTSRCRYATHVPLPWSTNTKWQDSSAVSTIPAARGMTGTALPSGRRSSDASFACVVSPASSGRQLLRVYP